MRRHRERAEPCGSRRAHDRRGLLADRDWHRRRSQNDFADLCEGVADYARKRLEISCTYPGKLTNFDDDVDDLHTLIREDGYLTCRVLVTDDAAVTGTFVLGAAGSAGSDAQRTETRTLRNLECMLFFEGAAGEKHLERLDRALDELRRELGP